MCDTHDPETYFAGVDIEETFREHGSHYKMVGGYREPIEEIEALILRAQNRWRKQSEGAD